MCLEDIRLMRKSRCVAKTVTLATGTYRQLCMRDPRRIALMINSCPLGINYEISFMPNPVVSRGLKIANASGLMILTLMEHGDMVCQAIQANGLSGAGDTFIEVVETFLDVL